MDLFNLVARLVLDKSEYEQGLSDTQKEAEGFGGKMAGAAKGAIAIGAAGAAAVTAIGGAVVKGAGQVASFGDSIDKQSQKLGMSAEAYQEWDAILQHSGASIDSMQRGMTTLSKAAEKGDDAFEKLGITQEELQTLNQEELFARTIAGLQGMESGTERTVLANKLLGGSSKELGALLNTSAEETEEMRKRVHELGGVMSNDAVKASAAYQDSLQDMTTAIDGAKRGLISNFLPSITTVMDGIGNLFSGDSDKGLGQIKEGIGAFLTQLTEMIPKVIEKGTQIVMALLGAIIENLPQIINAGVQAVVTLAQGIGQALPELIPSVVEAVLTIVEGLIDNIDLLIDAGIQLIIGLAQGLINAIPKIIEKIPTIIEKLISALISSSPKIAKAGVDLLSALVKNLPQIITKIVAAIPKIIAAIVKGFAGGIGQMVTAGKNLLAGLGNGIIEGAKGVIDKAKSVASNVLGAVKGFFGIKSPSTVFHGIGGYLMEGLANGITDSMGMVEDAMGSLDDLMYAEAPTEDLATDTSTTTSMFGDGPVTVPRQSAPSQQTVILQLDRMQLGRVVYQLNNAETQRVGVQLAGGFA